MYQIGCSQIRVYDVASMSCSYILAGHTDIVLCLDSCVSSSGSTLIVTGSKDNNVSCPFPPSLFQTKLIFLSFFSLHVRVIKKTLPDKVAF